MSVGPSSLSPMWPRRPGRPRPGVLLEVDDLLVQRQAPAAVLLRPAHAGPAVGAEVALPGQALLEEGVVVAGPAPAPDDGEVAAQAVLEERAGLGPERLVLGAEPQVHRPDATGRPDGPSDLESAPLRSQGLGGDLALGAGACGRGRRRGRPRRAARRGCLAPRSGPRRARGSGRRRRWWTGGGRSRGGAARERRRRGRRCTSGLVLGVEVAGGLVEDHDGRVLQQHAGDGQALLLAAGEAVAPLADDRVEAVGQARR